MLLQNNSLFNKDKLDKLKGNLSKVLCIVNNKIANIIININSKICMHNSNNNNL